MPEEIQLAKSIWCETGRKADVGAGEENFCLETGKCGKKKNTGDKQKRDEMATVATVATTAAVKGVCEDAAPHLSSSDEEEAVVNANVDAAVKATVKGEVVPKKRSTPAPCATAATISDSKRSCLRASSSDFLEAFQLSILQDEEARDWDWQD